MDVIYVINVMETTLEAVDFKLIGLRQSTFRQPLADIFSLITLELKNLTVLWMLNHCAIAGKFLKWINVPWRTKYDNPSNQFKETLTLRYKKVMMYVPFNNVFFISFSVMFIFATSCSK